MENSISNDFYLRSSIVLTFSIAVLTGVVLYFSGIVGDWKNHFTVAQNEMFDEIIGKEIKTLNFKFDYTL